jgi:hypothetical protein
MPDIQGPVVALYIRQTAQSSTELDSASVTIMAGPHFLPTPKSFSLWQTVVGQCPGPSITIARSLNVSLLREALTNRLEVILSYSQVTNTQGLIFDVVDAVQLLSSPDP